MTKKPIISVVMSGNARAAADMPIIIRAITGKVPIPTKNPSELEANIHIPINAVEKARKNSAVVSPRPIKAGFRTKKTGSKYITRPNLQAVKPVFIGGEPDTEDAANAPRATGGVIKESIPQYKIYKCTAIGSKPDLTNDGARTIAKKI